MAEMKTHKKATYIYYGKMAKKEPKIITLPLQKYAADVYSVVSCLSFLPVLHSQVAFLRAYTTALFLSFSQHPCI